jgi:hypothetical protein
LVREYLDSFVRLCDAFEKAAIYSFDETRFDWDADNKHTYDFKGNSRISGVKSVMLMIRPMSRNYQL